MNITRLGNLRGPAGVRGTNLATITTTRSLAQCLELAPNIGDLIMNTSQDVFAVAGSPPSGHMLGPGMMIRRDSAATNSSAFVLAGSIRGAQGPVGPNCQRVFTVDEIERDHTGWAPYIEWADLRAFANIGDIILNPSNWDFTVRNIRDDGWSPHEIIEPHTVVQLAYDTWNPDEERIVIRGQMGHNSHTLRSMFGGSHGRISFWNDNQHVWLQFRPRFVAVNGWINRDGLCRQFFGTAVIAARAGGMGTLSAVDNEIRDTTGAVVGIIRGESQYCWDREEHVLGNGFRFQSSRWNQLNDVNFVAFQSGIDGDHPGFPLGTRY